MPLPQHDSDALTTLPCRQLGEQAAQYQQEATQLKIMADINSAILAAESLESTISVAVNHIRHQIPCQRVVVLAIDQQANLKALGVDAVDGLSPQINLQVYEKMLDEPYLKRGRVGGVGDLEEVVQRSPFQEALSHAGIRSYMIVPLMAEEQLMGTLHLESVQPHAFDPQQVRSAKEIGTMLGVSLQQAYLREQTRQEIEEHKKTAEMLRRRTEMLEARNADLQAFAHTVAHDLKTPLTSVIGFSELLERQFQSYSDSELEAGLHRISESGRALMNIVDALLLLAKVQGKEEIALELLDMEPLVKETLDRLSDKITQANARIHLPDQWLPVVGYKPWIKEGWANYLSNAIKYGGQPPEIEVGVIQSSEGMAKYWVRDNGPGLTPAEQGKVFNRFERLGQQEVEGNGLGLSLVRRIIEKLGGDVGVDSRVGEGSFFYFTLPMCET